MSTLDEMLTELFHRVKTLETCPQTGLYLRTNARITTNESTPSTSYTDLATVGPEVTLDVPGSGTCLVIVRAFMTPGTGSLFMGVDISGATVLAASDSLAAQGGSGAFEATELYTDLAEGATTFTAKYRSVGGTAGFARRVLTVIPI